MFKFAHVLKQIHVQWTNSTPMDLLKTTADNDSRATTVTDTAFYIQFATTWK